MNYNHDILPLVILGGGGHARVIIDTCRAAGLVIAGVLDRNPPDTPAALLGAAYLGDDNRLDDPAFVAAHRFINGVGAQRPRRRLSDRLDSAGAVLATVIHPAAWVSPSATLGAGTLVVAGAIVNAAARIGRSAILNTGCSVDHDNQLGERCQVGPGARLAGTVTAGMDVVIGAGAVVIPGVTLGDNVTVGAGAVVLRDVAADSVVVGNPARPIGSPAKPQVAPQVAPQVRSEA